jgi:hypothetical protein
MEQINNITAHGFPLPEDPRPGYGFNNPDNPLEYGPPPAPAPKPAPAPYSGPMPASGLMINTTKGEIPAWTAIPDMKGVYTMNNSPSMGTSAGPSISGVRLPASGHMQEYKITGWRYTSIGEVPVYSYKYQDPTGTEVWVRRDQLQPTLGYSVGDPKFVSIVEKQNLVPVNWTEDSYLAYIGISPDQIQDNLINKYSFQYSPQIINSVIGETDKIPGQYGLVDKSGNLIEPIASQPVYGSGVWTAQAEHALQGVAPATPGSGDIREYLSDPRTSPEKVASITGVPIKETISGTKVAQPGIPGEWPISVQTALVPEKKASVPTFKAEGQPTPEPIIGKEILPGVLSETIYDSAGNPVEAVQSIYKQIYNNDTLDVRVQKVNDNIAAWASMTGQRIADNPVGFASDFALGMIPVVGTVAMWDKMEPWEKGLSIALDVAVLIPFVGEISSGVRSGASVYRAFGRAVISEVKAPFTAVAHPIETMKAGVMPVETLLRSDKVPLTALEIRTNTVRLPIADIGNAKDTMAARDILVDRAMGGGKPSIVIADKQIEMSKTALNETVIPAAVHSTPDVRPFIGGVTVEGTREGGLFVSPTLHTRFTGASAFGDMPEGGIKGAVIIRDPGVLSKIQPTGKIYRGAAEIEKMIPEGVNLPPASQMLMTRNAANEPLALVIIGKPFTTAEIASMKLVGAADLVADIFRPAITVAGKASKYDELVNIGREAKILESEIKVAKIERAGSNTISKLENELRYLDNEARIRAAAIDREYAAASSLRPIGITAERYIDSLTYNDVARTNPDELAYVLSTASTQDRERIINDIDSQYRGVIERRTNQIVNGSRTVSRDIIDRTSIPAERATTERITSMTDRIAADRITGRSERAERVSRTSTTADRVNQNRETVVPDRVNPDREIVTPDRVVIPSERIVIPENRKVTPSERIPIVPIITPIPDRVIPKEVVVIKTKHGEKTVTREQLEGAVAWKQGIMYITWVKPFDQSDLLYTRKPIPQVKYFTGPGSAAKSIVAMFGEVPDFLHADMGVVDITVKGQGKAQPILSFREDKYVSRRRKRKDGSSSVRGIWSSPSGRLYQ